LETVWLTVPQSHNLVLNFHSSSSVWFCRPSYWRWCSWKQPLF